MSLSQLIFVLLAVFYFDLQQVSCSSNASSPRPLRFPPSLYWDGIDGSWSSFTVQIGTPPQSVRLLPSITGNTIWAVLPEACQDSITSTCEDGRGGIFKSNQSSTWEDQGFFELPLHPQHYLPFSGAANYGFDHVAVDWQGNGGMTLENQVISAYITQDFYVGSLGLSPSSVNIASFDDQFPSFLGTLKQQNQIPSNSYGYTAGASYRKFPASAYGSLTLGGYDSTRMDPSKNLTIPGADDNYRPLLLVIERITSESTELLDAPIVTALDSLVSHIWLPISACQHFESVFGLVWNPTFSLYIVNDTQHSALLEQNASVTFTLCTGSIQEKDDSLEITLPYAAFDLTAEPPFAGLNETVHYFPLKRAANDTQYTLGRTILQEMYMIADYDRDALSLFPAIFPDSSVEPNLVPIDPPGQVPGDPVPQNNALSIAAIVGIVVGVIAFLTLVAGGIWFYKRYSRREKANKAVLDLSFSGEKAELSSDGAFHGRELEGTVASVTTHPSLCPAGSTDCKDSQLDSSISSPLSEMPGDQGGSELCRHREIYEMP